MSATLGSTMLRIDHQFDVGSVVGGSGEHVVATSTVIPADGRVVAVLCCVPGGAASRHYFDLAVGDDASYSFAEYAAARGMIVIAVDNLGTGASRSSAPAAALTAATVAAANEHAFAEAIAALRDGSFAPRVRAVPEPVTIAVGHSMGAMLSVVAQATTARHAGLAVLGFSTHGLPTVLSAAELALTAPERHLDELVSLAMARFTAPPAPHDEIVGFRFPFHLDDSPVAARRALAATGTRLLPVPALQSMLPGNVTEAAAAVEVPVFIGIGDHELWVSLADLVSQFPATNDVTAYLLEQAAHTHTIATTRHQLWARLCHWAAGVAESRPGAAGPSENSEAS